MPNRSGLPMLLALVVLGTGVAAVSAQGQHPVAPVVVSTSDTIHLVFDHLARTLTAASRADSQLIESQHGETIRLRRSAHVQLTVVHTNTALYDVVITDTIEAAPPTSGNPASGDMSSVISIAHSFFPQALGIMTASRGTRAAEVWKSTLPDVAPDGATENMKRTLAVAQNMEHDLASLDTLFAGPRSIASFRDHIRAALQRMRDTTPEQAAQFFRSSIGWHAGERCHTTTGDTLALSSRLLRHYQALRPQADSLARGLTDSGFVSRPGFRDSLAVFRARADSAIRTAEQLTEPAYTTEHLVTVVSGACSRQEATRRPVVSASIGERFVVQISRRSDADIAPVVADLPAPPGPVAVTVLPPRALVTVSAGLSLLVAPNARFPTFATRADSTPGAKGVQIYQQNTTDARYSWGATVGLSWRFLDWTAKSGFALWVPEITIQQSQGSTGFALGSALSWHAVKLGAGLLWVQHAVLQTNHPGDHIPNAGYLLVANSYGQPNWYLSFSVFGVPGFVSKP